jgi:hypothetical protein
MPLTYMAGLDWYAPYLIDPGGGYGYIGHEHMASEVFYGQIDIAPAPEPGTLILLGAGLVGISMLRRRRQS